MADISDLKLRRALTEATRTPEQQRAALRRLVRAFYDFQRLRMQSAGRTHHKTEKDEDEEKVDKTPIIELHVSDQTLLEQRSSELLKLEKAALKDIEYFLKTMPAYTQILAERPRFKGIGPTIAGVILAEVDIHRANTPSALWRYAGLAPVPAHRCRECQDVVVPRRPRKIKAEDRTDTEVRFLHALINDEVLLEDATVTSVTPEKLLDETVRPIYSYLTQRHDRKNSIYLDTIIDELGDDVDPSKVKKLFVKLDAIDNSDEASDSFLIYKYVAMIHQAAATMESGGGTWKHRYKRKRKCTLGNNLRENEVFESRMAETPVKGKKLHYNSFLKTKMVGVMADCLLRSGSPYRSFYDNYKHRQASAGKGRDDGHRHRRARRYMVKMVLRDIWIDWRTLEGLDVRVPYEEEYLGKVHSG